MARRVSIPLTSGQRLRLWSGIVDDAREGLNPFDFRATTSTQQVSGQRREAKVSIPLTSGQRLRPREDCEHAVLLASQSL